MTFSRTQADRRTLLLLRTHTVCVLVLLSFCSGCICVTMTHSHYMNQINQRRAFMAGIEKGIPCLGADISDRQWWVDTWECIKARPIQYGAAAILDAILLGYIENRLDNYHQGGPDRAVIPETVGDRCIFLTVNGNGNIINASASDDHETIATENSP